MELKKGTSVLVIRFNNYGKYDFIKEHQRLIDANGYTWMFKVGRPIQGPKMDAVMRQGGYLILKAPKASGNGYYLTKILASKTGKKPSDCVYPSYYQMMVDDDRIWNMDTGKRLTTTESKSAYHLYRIRNNCILATNNQCICRSLYYTVAVLPAIIDRVV